MTTITITISILMYAIVFVNQKQAKVLFYRIKKKKRN